MSDLLKLQCEFAETLPRLLTHIITLGYHYNLDWAYRPPEVAAYYASIGVGVRNSNHCYKLAVDINLFDANYKWLRLTSDHQIFGAYWETLHPLARWGGKWGDGNHYSFQNPQTGVK